MSHLAAFLLRSLAWSTFDRRRALRRQGIRIGAAILDMLEAAGEYDGHRPEIVRLCSADPVVAMINAPGGEA